MTELNAVPQVADYEEDMRGVADDLFKVLDKSFEGRWRSCLLAFRACNNVEEIRFTTLDQDSSMLSDVSKIVAGAQIPEDVLFEEGMAAALDVVWLNEGIQAHLKSMRTKMWNPLKGTWFSLRLKVTEVGECKFDFEFDKKPPFEAKLTDEDWLADNKSLPRPAFSMPTWHPAATA